MRKSSTDLPAMDWNISRWSGKSLVVSVPVKANDWLKLLFSATQKISIRTDNFLSNFRSEAKGVPNLLVAPVSPTAPSTDLYADYVQGYYSNGAYTAVPSIVDQSAVKNGETDEDLDPQEAYYASLCRRFGALSAILQSSPPENVLNPSCRESALSLNRLSRTSWQQHILYTEPSMLLLSQLRQESIIYGLRVLEKSLTKRNLQKFEKLGLWAWGLLARCREVGQMGSEEVGTLRDLGKKASWIIRGIKAGMEDHEEQIADNTPEEPDNSETEDETEPRDPENPPTTESPEPDPNPNPHPQNPQPPPSPLTSARQKLLTSLSPPQLASDHNTTAVINDDASSSSINAILDMIVTVVGEFYGQRDLLGGRGVWEEGG